MPLIVREILLYFVLMAILTVLHVPGVIAATVSGIAFAAIIWRETQR